MQLRDYDTVERFRQDFSKVMKAEFNAKEE